MKVRIDHPSITEKIAKTFAGDEGPFPYRSGPKLVAFFNRLGFSDSYGQGFPTRWRYAEERISDLHRSNRFEEFILHATSIEELISFVEISRASEQQLEILDYLNQNIFILTDKQVKLISGEMHLVSKETEKPLGSGYFAEVYPLVKDGKKYAIKRLKKEFWSNREAVHRFKREYELMENLNGSGYTIEVQNYSDNEKSFVMELADATLKQFIEANYHTMNDAWKEHVCEKIISSIIKLHKSMLHRDLSYNNILMVNHEPKLADFGLGKDETADYSYKTVTEQGVGTAHFTDPIQLRNFKDANVQTDIYSLGRIIDYIFDGSIVSQEHKYSGVVVRATHKDLSKRYSTADELNDAFQKVKNFSYLYDPVKEIIEMSRQDNFSSEKLYKIFTRQDAGNVLFQLILDHYSVAVAVAGILSVQYEHEFEMLIDSLEQEMYGSRLTFSEYDNFGYFAMEMILEITGQSEMMNKLADILLYVAQSVNRFSIQKLIEKHRNNSRIPYAIRDKLNQ